MRAEKILSRINELSLVSEDKEGITRTYGTTAFIEGRDKVINWMREAGLKTSIDNIGNVRGILSSPAPNAKTFIIASHIDTVCNAGKFDGPLGVLMGLDILENLISLKKKIPFNIELIAFCDEEGVRFHTTYLGSKVVAGTFDNSLLEISDATGTSLKEILKSMGADASRLSGDAIPADQLEGYFEIHIEQGPVLYEKNIPVAVVTAIAGQIRAEIIFKGEAGHAGTVPIHMRADALAAASEFIVELEKLVSGSSQRMIATVGKLHIPHSASNVIPGEVICSLDLRSADENVLSSSLENIKEMCGAICAKRNIEMSWNVIQQTKPVLCDKRLNTVLAYSINNAGYEIIELVSGAGHDAVALSAVSPVSMLFVRCYKGISHNPLENVELKDIAAAIKVSDNFMERLLSGLANFKSDGDRQT